LRQYHVTLSDISLVNDQHEEEWTCMNNETL
jgi:hypothetical protein